MDRFEGTLARQLALIDPDFTTVSPRSTGREPHLRPTFRLLKQDVYAELARRRRRAQIAARHLLDEQDKG